MVNLYIPTPKNYKNGIDSINIYIDFNKNDDLLYNIIFLKELNIAIRIPLIEAEDLPDKLKIERFYLNNNTFLISI